MERKRNEFLRSFNNSQPDQQHGYPQRNYNSAQPSYEYGGRQNNGNETGQYQNYGGARHVNADKMAGRQTSSEVIFGDALHLKPPIIHDNPAIWLRGINERGELFSVPLSESILSRHIMLLGGIGTGKTNAFFQMINQLGSALSKDDVMVIFDTKGDFYKEFYISGDVVISNDSTAADGTGQTGYWNIFDEVDRGEHEYESVMEISRAIFAEECSKTNQIFFPNAARDIFMAIMLHFLRSVKPELQNNYYLIYYIRSRTSAQIRKMLESYNDLRSLSSYISKDDSAQTQGVISELQQVVRNIFVGNFAEKGNLGLRSLVKKKKGRKIFIEYDLSLGETLTPVYSLMFDMAIKQALGRSRSEGNVYFITDEFRLLPNLQHIDDAVNFGRSLGIKFMIGIQNIEQIIDNYGESRAKSIMSGFLTLISFRVNDPESRKFIKDHFGGNRKVESYVPIVQNRGLVEQEREASVVEDWDIMNLKTGQAIIGMPNEEPFVFQFEKYNEKNG